MSQPDQNMTDNSPENQELGVQVFADWLRARTQKQLSAVILGILGVAALSALAWSSIVAPKIAYSKADAPGKCAIRLARLHDSDKYCDAVSNQILSKKTEAEKARRAALTPMQRCEEDMNSYDYTSAAEDGSVPVCQDDGTVSYIDPTDDLSSYYSDQADQLAADSAAADDSSQPACDIKGNISYNTGEKIYHLPGDTSYDSTVINEAYGERWFCSEQEAMDAGWRHAYN